MTCRSSAALLLLALLLPVGPARAQGNQSAPGSPASRERARQDIVALAQEMVAFARTGYTAVPPDQVLPRFDDYLGRIRARGQELAGTAAAPMLDTLLAQLEQVRNDYATAKAREDAAGSRLQALLAEMTAAHGYDNLPPQQRLARFDSALVRLQALGPEMAGTRAATDYEQLLHSTQEERARVAMQLGRDPFTAPGMAAGPYALFSSAAPTHRKTALSGGIRAPRQRRA